MLDFSKAGVFSVFLEPVQPVRAVIDANIKYTN